MHDLPYADPTGNAAATHLDAQAAMRDGINPDLALHVADTHLPPIEFAIAQEAKNSYMRNEHGQRVSVLPYLDPDWSYRRRARPLRNSELADIVAALAPFVRSPA